MKKKKKKKRKGYPDTLGRCVYINYAYKKYKPKYCSCLLHSDALILYYIVHYSRTFRNFCLFSFYY